MYIFRFFDLIVYFFRFLRKIFQNKKIKGVKEGILLLIAGIIWVESALAAAAFDVNKAVNESAKTAESVQTLVDRGWGFRTPQNAPAGCENKLDKEISTNNICEDIPIYDDRTDCYADDLMGSPYWNNQSDENPFLSVLNYGKKSCHCCKNPSKCMFGKAGGMVTFLEGIGVIGGLAAIGGVSKVCKDIGKLQAALAGLNGTAGIMCRRKGGQCQERHGTCLQKIEEVLPVIEARIGSCEAALGVCSEGGMCDGSLIDAPSNSSCAELVNEGIRTKVLYDTAASERTEIETHHLSTLEVKQVARINEDRAREAAQQVASQARSNCGSIKTTLEEIKNSLSDDLKPKLEGGIGRCEFTKKAGNAQFIQGATLGAASAASFLCAKQAKGSGPSELSCTDDNNAQYNSLRCRCERGEEKAPECCSVNPTHEGCNPCLSNPSSAACICQNPANQNLQQCRQSCAENPDQIFCKEDPGEEAPPAPNPDAPGPPAGVWEPLSSDDFGGPGSPFGDPNIQLPNKNAKTPFNPGASKSSKARGSGPPAVSGGSLPSLGGSGGSEGEEEAGAAGGGSDPYANLLDGLTGRTSKARRGSSYGGGSKAKSRGNMFDLRKLFPKKNKRKPASGAGKPSNRAAGESIFEKSSRMTQIYCSRNQIECR